MEPLSLILELFGRTHPMLLHLPIGLIVAVSAVEGYAAIRKTPLPRSVMQVLLGLTAISAALSAASGWFLSREAGYSSAAVQLHMWLGIAVAVLVTATFALFQRSEWTRAYRVALAASLGAIVPAGHLGASLTHGERFLFEPLDRAGDSTLVAVEAGDAERRANAPFSTQIRPIFATRCITCHGEARQRGRLALHTIAGIKAGGKSGPLFAANDPEHSELVRRIRLPLDDQSHMPPEGKPQLSDAEIAAIEAWVRAGAVIDNDHGEPTLPTTSARSDGAVAENAESQALPPIDPSAVAAVQARLGHVERLGADSRELWVDLSACSAADDAAVRELLAPLARNIAELSLARTAISDESLGYVLEMPRLRRLDLRSTGVSSVGLEKLQAHTALEELNLTQTRVGDESVDALAMMPGLRRVFAWKSEMTPSGARALRERRAEMQLEIGEAPSTAPAETEAEIRYSSDAPIPGAARGAVPASLAAVNVTCPVTGSAIDPRFLVVFENRVIGFCCEKCPSVFWAAPDKYRDKLPK